MSIIRNLFTTKYGISHLTIIFAIFTVLEILSWKWLSSTGAIVIESADIILGVLLLFDAIKHHC